MKVYPSIEELIPSILRAKLPAALIDEVSDRYETLGEKYLTKNFAPDGRQINGMMITDRISNCREEIVDAVFCMLGQIFKEDVMDRQPDDRIYDILMGLIEIYAALRFMENEGTYIVAVDI